MRRGAGAPIAAAVGIAAVAAAAAIFIARDFTAGQRRRFEAVSATAEELVRDGVHARIALLQGAAGAFAAAPALTCAQFAHFVKRMDLETHYPGTLGVGYSVRVPPDGVEALEREAGFRVWPDTPRDEYHVIRCLEPPDRRNRAALGYDMFTEPVRRQAMSRARDTGAAALTGRVELVQEIDAVKQPGFLIYLPVYRGETVPPDVASRRRDLRGFVYAPLRAGDFMRRALEATGPRLHLELYDGPAIDETRLLYRGDTPAAADFEPIVRTFEMAGRTWTLQFQPGPAQQRQRERLISIGILAGGLLLSLLLYRALSRAQRAAAEAAVAERRARESSELAARGADQLASIMDAVSALVSFIDREERYQIVNKRYEEWFDQPRSAIEGRSVREVMGDATYASVRDAISSALAGHSASAEAELPLPDGSRRFVLASYTPQRDREGQVQGAIALVADITDLKKAQHAVEASEANLRAILNTSLDAVIQMDTAGTVVFWNPRAEELFGWTPAEACGRTVAELIVPPRMRDAHRDGLARVLATGEARILGRPIEVPALRRDGREVPVELTVTSVSGREPLFSAFVSDRSERNRTETARRFLTDAAMTLTSSLERERVRNLIPALAVPYLATGAALVTFAGPGAPPFHGRAGAMTDADAAAWAGRLAAEPPPAPGVQTSEAGAEGARVLPLVSGPHHIGAIVLAGPPANPGKPEEDRGIAEEYARRAAMALHNAQLYEQAQTANRLKDDFLSTLSHELRTPANAILGWAQMARDGASRGQDVSRALEAVLRNAHAQNDLISDILDAQRLTTGKVRLDLDDVHIRAVILAALEAVRPAALAKRIDLRPDVAQACTVFGDADRLQQVFWNLLSNAIKFTPPGGVVDVQCSRGARGVTVQVRDTGPGIAPDFLPFVFERFRQADASATKSHSGLGLGLAIAKNLTELHGGTIEVSNRTDGQSGAQFCVYLPTHDFESER